MFAMHPVAKPYAWGSYSCLQSMFDSASEEIPEGPLAEMWFSGHRQWPSMLDMPGQGSVPLTNAIRNNPDGMIGERGSAQFGPVLPYLLKIISARIPLSLQVHPVGFEARAGYNAENAANIPFDSPLRSFRDPIEKCEMVVALEPFRASVGFASIPFMLRNLKLVEHPIAARMVDALSHRFSLLGHAKQEDAQAEAMMPVSAAVWPESRRQVFRAFHAAVTAEPTAGLLDALIAGSGQVSHPRSRLAFQYAITAAEDFPDDPSVLSLLMLNPVLLNEGESVFIPAGTPHAYIHGTAAEIMTNSDNVLRAGMTVKHKDIGNLLHTLDCRTAAPIDPAATNLVTLMMRDVVVYKPDAEAFMLAYGHVDANHRQWTMLDRLVRRYGKLVEQIGVESSIPGGSGPRILVCTDGAVRCSSTVEERVVRCGEAVFIPAEEGWISVGPPTGEHSGGVNQSSGSFIVASTQL